MFLYIQKGVVLVSSISNEHGSTRTTYIPRSSADIEKGFIVASAASGAVMSTLPLFSKPFNNQLRAERVNNQQYKDAFIKAFNLSDLKDSVKICNLEFTLSDNLKRGTALEKEISNFDIKAGANACYVPSAKEIMLNVNKTSIAAFHEAGHAMNHLQSRVGKFLQNLRSPGYAIAGLMGTVALFSRKKPKENDNNLMDFVKNNCGKIAFLSMLPIVAEEGLATYKGIKLARAGGLCESAIKNLKKFYGKALMTYVGHAVVTGLSVGLASMIMDYYSRPKKIEKHL